MTSLDDEDGMPEPVAHPYCEHYAYPVVERIPINVNGYRGALLYCPIHDEWWADA